MKNRPTSAPTAAMTARPYPIQLRITRSLYPAGRLPTLPRAESAQASFRNAGPSEAEYASGIDGLTPILAYRGFYDVPRMFVVTTPDGLIVFDSPFDDELDDYRPDYAVYFFPWSEARRLHDPWNTLTDGAELRGHVPIADVTFDETRRLMVSAAVVDRFANAT